MARGPTGKKLEGADLLKKADFKIRDGHKYYRVTSILGLVNPSEVQVSEDHLMQYAARGTAIHAEAAEMLQGVVNLKEKRAALATLAEGDLGLEPIKKQVLKDFMLKYPEYLWREPLIVETELWDKGLSLTGTPDIVLVKDRKACLCDWKTTSNYSPTVKEKYFKQLGGYALMLKRLRGIIIDELHLFPLKPKNKYGYGAPIIETNVTKYINLFLEDYKSLNPNINV